MIDRRRKEGKNSSGDWSLGGGMALRGIRRSVVGRVGLDGLLVVLGYAFCMVIWISRLGGGFF